MALLLLGKTWFLSTILFYPALLLFLYYTIKLFCWIFKIKTPKSAIKYWIIIVGFFLLFVDLTLRLFALIYQSYTEKNYGWVYSSPHTNGFDAFKLKYFSNCNNCNYISHSPNSSYTFKTADFQYQHTYNEYGIRDRNNLKDQILNKKVCLTIGDSFTEGVGTHQDSTWQILLENNFTNLYGDSIIFINAGISGFDPINATELYYTLKNDLNPDYVIMSISLNDVIDVLNRGGKENRIKRSQILVKQPAGYYFYSWSYIFRVICHNIYDYPEIFMNDDEYKAAEKIACKDIENEIYNISESLKSDGGKLIIISFPDLWEFKNLSYSSQNYIKLIERISTNTDIMVIDFIDYINSIDNKNQIIVEELYWQTDAHFTPKGYKLWSEIVFSELNQSKTLMEGDYANYTKN